MCFLAARGKSSPSVDCCEARVSLPPCTLFHTSSLICSFSASVNVQSISSSLDLFLSPSEVTAGALPVLGLGLGYSPSIVGKSLGVLFLVARLCALGAALIAAFNVGALDV